jgi:23S rRNA pseudouridine1911/1915/1917 synthase
MEWLGYPLVGDPLYGAPQTKLNTALKKGGYSDKNTIDYIQSYPYQALHARELSFIHPRTNQTLTFMAEYSDSFKELYKHLSAS